jgi:hypothetical protein
MMTTVQIGPGVWKHSQTDAAAANLIAHEGTHVDDERTWLHGRDWHTYTVQESYQTELNAFGTQSFVDQVLNLATPLWHPGISRADQLSAVQGAAYTDAYSQHPRAVGDELDPHATPGVWP